jgi:rhodanese-related sulfurtransferase
MIDEQPPVPVVTPREALRLTAEEGAVIVDVREAEELARTGRLAGALHMPLGMLPERAGQLPRDRPILIYCAAGIRSAVAARALAAMGWPSVYNLGGFAEAAAEGIPVEAADA